MKCRCQGEFCQYLMVIRSTPDRESAPTIPIVAIDVTSLPVKIHPATERTRMLLLDTACCIRVHGFLTTSFRHALRNMQEKCPGEAS